MPSSLAAFHRSGRTSTIQLFTACDLALELRVHFAPAIDCLLMTTKKRSSHCVTVQCTKYGSDVPLNFSVARFLVFVRLAAISCVLPAVLRLFQMSEVPEAPAAPEAPPAPSAGSVAPPAAKVEETFTVAPSAWDGKKASLPLLPHLILSPNICPCARSYRLSSLPRVAPRNAPGRIRLAIG